MADYPRLRARFHANPPGSPHNAFERIVVSYLIDVWLDDYAQRARSSDIVETRASGFSYLFDVASERLLAAWGISAGRSSHLRDKARMAGHPLSAGSLYHRGHAIPHTLGGPTDINLVPQRGSVNVGPFRILEKRAVATPGSFYFTYWIYPLSTSARPTQTPTSVDQGLLLPGQPPSIPPIPTNLPGSALQRSTTRSTRIGHLL